jgi:hypothetical protein
VVGVDQGGTEESAVTGSERPKTVVIPNAVRDLRLLFHLLARNTLNLLALLALAVLRRHGTTASGKRLAYILPGQARWA